MAGELVIVGNLTDDPIVKFLPSGVAVANFTVAQSQRQYDKDTKQWSDGEPMFLRVSIFREYAENIAESLRKGDRVIVSGKLKSRSYEKDGEKRTVFEVEADEVGPALRFATAQVSRKTANGGGSKPVADDPWGATPQSGGFTSSTDSPPF